MPIRFGDDSETRLYGHRDLAGWPGIALPTGIATKGLPLGLQN